MYVSTSSLVLGMPFSSQKSRLMDLSQGRKTEGFIKCMTFEVIVGPMRFLRYSLSIIWGYIHNECQDPLKPLLVFAAMDITRLLSYADEQVPKLFKSKRKTKKLDMFLREGWSERTKKRYVDVAKKYLRAVLGLKECVGSNRSLIEVCAPQDIDKWKPDRPYRAIITSPPYLQAQEYIRSSKIDLYWLGHNDEEMRKWSGCEIPYRSSKGRVSTPTIDFIREELLNSSKPHLTKLYDTYFYFVLTNLLKVSHSLQSGGHLCIFVGSPTIAGMDVPLWKILVEYFEERGFETQSILEDKIVARRLFAGRDNPNPRGIQSEFLAAFRKANES